MSDRLEKKMAPAEERTGAVKRKWTRINRREDISAQGWKPQEEAEEGACRDMEKPIEQLLSDIHEGYWKRIGGKTSDSVALTLEILMRMGSMMAVVSKSNERLQNALLVFTIVIVILTGLMISIATLTAPLAEPVWPRIPFAAGIVIVTVVVCVVVSWRIRKGR